MALSETTWEDLRDLFLAGLYGWLIVAGLCWGGTIVSRLRGAGFLVRWQGQLQRYVIAFHSSTHLSLQINVVELLWFLSSSAVPFVYVAGTYQTRVLPWLRATNLVMGAIFLVVFIGRLISTPKSWLFPLRRQNILECWSISSLLLASGPQNLNFSYLQAFSAGVVFERIESRLVARSEVDSIIGSLVIRSILFFFLFASTFQLLEVPGPIWVEISPPHDVTWFNSLYYLFVTLSTVGYGDFSPSTFFSRFFVMFTIVYGIVFFTRQVTLLVEATQKRKGSGSFQGSNDDRHVILTGTFRPEDLGHFADEFYSVDANHLHHVVILRNSDDPQKWSKAVQRCSRSDLIVYLSGDVFSSSDLARARADSALGAFVLTNPNTTADPTIEDSATIMAALALRMYRNDLPIFAEVLLRDSKLQMAAAIRISGENEQVTGRRKSSRNLHLGLHWTLEQHGCDLGQYENPYDEVETALQRSTVFCLQDHYLALVAENIRCHGLTTLLGNMLLYFPSHGDEQREPPWLREYRIGSKATFHHTTFPRSADGVLLRNVAMRLFRAGMMLVAVKSEPLGMYSPANCDTLLSPGLIGLFLSHHRSVELKTRLEGVFSQEITPCEPSEWTELIESLQRARAEKTEALAANFIAALGQKRRSNPDVEDESHKRQRATISSVDFLNSLDAASPRSPPVRLPVLSPTSEKGRSSQGWGQLRHAASSSSLLHKVSRGRDSNRLPHCVRNHVILCMNGIQRLFDVGMFLLFFRKSNAGPVVIIVPTGVDAAILQEFAEEHENVHFILGVWTNARTWRRAKLSVAESVVIMFEARGEEGDGTLGMSRDAESLFLAFTLDSLTDRFSPLYIQFPIYEESTMRFLREPTHSRRTTTTFTHQPHHLHSLAQTAAMDSGSASSHSFDLPFLRRRRRSSSSQEDYGSQADGHHSGRARLSARGRLFDRIQYASGELIPYGAGRALLIRQYSDPGLVELVDRIIGMESHGANNSMVRLVSLPPEFFDTKGESSRTFEEVVSFFLGLGLLAVGLYRAGDAPVLVPRWDPSKQPSVRSRSRIPSLISSAVSRPNLGTMPSENVFQDDPSSEEYDDLGLARNQLPYVYSFPLPRTIISRRDRVFIFCAADAKIPWRTDHR